MTQTQVKQIVLYTKKKDCPGCEEAKRFLADHKIEYVSKDVVENREFMMELVKNYRSMSVPTLVVDGAAIIGFKKDEYEKLLGL
jgi:glutaredoxin